MIFISTVLSFSPVWTSKEVYTTWINRGYGYEYVVEIYTDKDYTKLYQTYGPTTSRDMYITFYDTNLYFQRIKYYLSEQPNDYTYEYLGRFYLNLELGILSEDIPEYLEGEEEQHEDNITPPPEQPVIQKQPYILPDLIDYREDILPRSSQSLVLGVSTEQDEECNISLIKKESTSIKSWSCNLDIQISNVKYLDWGEYKSLEIRGIYPQYISANIKVYECKKFTLFELKTWFGCKEVLIDSYKGDIKLTYFGNTFIDGIYQKSTNFGFMDTSFYLSNKFKEDISKKRVQISLNIYSQIKGKDWIDMQYSIKKDISIPKLEKSQTNKPFSFPIDRLIGVTQWHGCTKYQCPHKGIDFGARLNKVISIGDGEVVNVGYDKYGGECNQGGNYVIIKHSNGMYSTYFHLASYGVKVGNRVSKGSVIGVSGNTGRKNCQPLGYHLHFETRAGLSSSTHVNPVEYVGVDWNQVSTIGYKQFPKRLTGDNPHPNF